MRHPRVVIASIALAAAAAIGGGITAAAATTSHPSSRPAASQQAAATVRTAQATVAGKTETILVNSQGLPVAGEQVPGAGFRRGQQGGDFLVDQPLGVLGVTA